MFKFIGTLIVSLCVAIYFLKNNYILHTTKQFLHETCKILNLIFISIDTGIKYSEIFNRINLKQFNIYSTFDFCNQDAFWQDLYEKKLIKRLYIDETKYLFENIGKKSSVKEKYFISQNQVIFENYLNDIEKSYKENKKMNNVLGICAGIFVFIILI